MHPSQTQVLDVRECSRRFKSASSGYQEASPFPYGQFDDFLFPEAARAAMEAFPKVEDQGWIHYVHVNEKKHGLNKRDLIPEPILRVIDSLNTPEFLRALEELTGIEGLKADPSLEGGGLHQSQRGGYLNIHADFTVHPHKRNWRRRVNLLVYLNEDWQPSYRGDLELWTRDMKRCARKISPIFNRCVIFNTDEDSYHGLPDPIQCPEGMSRKSIALYYFTEESHRPRRRTTNYRARPSDGARSVLIWADKKLVSLYSRLKGTLGINDDFISALLNRLGKKK